MFRILLNYTASEALPPLFLHSCLFWSYYPQFWHSSVQPNFPQYLSLFKIQEIYFLNSFKKVNIPTFSMQGNYVFESIEHNIESVVVGGVVVVSVSIGHSNERSLWSQCYHVLQVIPTVHNYSLYWVRIDYLSFEAEPKKMLKLQHVSSHIGTLN